MRLIHRGIPATWKNYVKFAVLITVVLSWSSLAVSIWNFQSSEQANPRIINYLRSKIVPPSTLPYNLTPSNLVEAVAMADSETILQNLFPHKIEGRFFEAGAYDGELDSTTLMLETKRGWRGLLVEPSDREYNKLITKHRKAMLFHGCVSSTSKAIVTEFREGGMVGRILEAGHRKKVLECLNLTTGVLMFSSFNSTYDLDPVPPSGCKVIGSTVKSFCAPLLSYLIAADLTTLDFLSLDTEGSEFLILQTLPFHMVDIKVIRVDTSGLQEFPEMIKFLRRHGYRMLRTLHGQDISTYAPYDTWFTHVNFEISQHFT